MQVWKALPVQPVVLEPLELLEQQVRMATPASLVRMAQQVAWVAREVPVSLVRVV